MVPSTSKGLVCVIAAGVVLLLLGSYVRSARWLWQVIFSSCRQKNYVVNESCPSPSGWELGTGRKYFT